MADLNKIGYLYSYSELSDAKDLWEEFLKSQMSSVYNGDFTNSAIHSSLTRAISGLLGSLDLMFDETMSSLSVKDIPQELLYTHFGFLLKDKRGRSSLEEYRELLANLIEVLFKGLSKNVAKEELVSKFGVPSIKVELPPFQKNTTLGSKGLGNSNSFLGLSPEVGFVLGGYNDNSNYLSSKESNIVTVVTELDSNLSFNPRVLKLIFDILKLVGSTITPIKLKFFVQSTSMIGRSTTALVEQLHSLTNFRGIDRHLIHFPSREVKVTSEILQPEDSFDYTSIITALDKTSAEYTLNISDLYNVTKLEEGNLPRVFETIERKDFCYTYGDFTYDMRVLYGCDSIVEDEGCPIDREQVPPYSSKFGDFEYGDFVLSGENLNGFYIQPSRNTIGDALEIGNFVIGYSG